MKNVAYRRGCRKNHADNIVNYEMDFMNELSFILAILKIILHIKDVLVDYYGKLIGGRPPN